MCFNNYLKEIDLSINEVWAETLKFLQVTLKGNITIRKIDLCHNDTILSDSMIKLVGGHLHLEEFNFKHTSFDEELIT